MTSPRIKVTDISPPEQASTQLEETERYYPGMYSREPPSRSDPAALRHARRIYHCVLFGRDSEAEAALNSLGDLRIPTAVAILTGEYQQTPSRAARDWAGCLTVTGFPVICTLLFTRIFGIPVFIEGPFAKAAYYTVITVIAAIVESTLYYKCYYRVVRILRDGYRLKWPSYRIREISCKVLAKEDSSDPRLIGAILSTGIADSLGYKSPSRRSKNLVNRALTRALNTASPETLLHLTSVQRTEHCNRLSTCTHLLFHQDPYRLDIMRSSNSDASANAALASALLNTYEYLADFSALERVRRISETTIEDLPPEWVEVIQTAQRILPLLEDNIAKSRSRDQLLRRSEAPPESPDELLRPHQESDSDGDDLLRPFD